MDYKNYIDLWLQIIEETINKNIYSYNDNNYNNNEWRFDSTEWEKDLLKSLVSKSLKYLEDDKWYNYYEHTEYDDLYFIIPKWDRHWFDFWITLKWIFFPVNIKITKWDSHDNLFWLSVIKYLLFWPDSIDKYGCHNIVYVNDESKISQKIFDSVSDNKFNNIKEDFKTTIVRDYFLLSINKNTWHITTFPFLNIPKENLMLNPSNWFQANFEKIPKWISNDILFEENINKMIYMYYEYVSKKASPYILLSQVL